MRTFLLLACSLLAFPASADHHRGHINFHAKAALKHLTSAENGWRRFEQNWECLTGLWVVCHRIDAQVASIGNQLKAIRGALERMRDNAHTEDLDELRRVLTRPKNETPTSTDTRIFSATYQSSVMLNFFEMPPASRNYLLGYQRNMVHMWEDLDRVLWHINDAIREEIYQDVDFGYGHPPMTPEESNLAASGTQN